MPMVDFLDEVYRMESFEYDRPEGDSFLISAGTGLMLSVMDSCPSLRWCADVDIMTPGQKERLGDYLTCVGNVTERVVCIGWFCTTSPWPLARAVSRLRRERFHCYIQFHGVGEDPFAGIRTARTLAELVDHVNADAQNRFKMDPICQKKGAAGRA